MHPRGLTLNVGSHYERSLRFRGEWVNFVRKSQKVICLQFDLADLSQVDYLSESRPKRRMHS